MTAKWKVATLAGIAVLCSVGTYVALNWRDSDESRALFEDAGIGGTIWSTDALPAEIAYSDFLRLLDQGAIAGLVLKEDRLAIRTRGGGYTLTLLPEGFAPEVATRAAAAGVELAFLPPEDGRLADLMISLIPALILLGPILYLLAGGFGRNGLLGIGRSPAQLIDPKRNGFSFADVAGVEDAKEELAEVIAFLKDPGRFQSLGGRMPKGLLLLGPPGTGKTLLARAVAGEAKVPFFSISGSEFVEMFVGLGARRVRSLFRAARRQAPCIVFIDEIDAVGRRRNGGGGAGHDEHDQTLNQLLVEIDGFDPAEGVVLIGATNRPDVLDPALLRPGRFDRQVNVGNPDLKGRAQILAVHMRKLKVAEEVDPLAIARGTPGFSGADLANLVNEAALIAARRGAEAVDAAAFEAAKDKLLMGAERRSLTMSEEERRLTAYHEAGHALIALNEPHSDPLHKATILPRGRSLGQVVRLPERDQISATRAKLEADLAVAMGGRAAEELVFGPDRVTTGAAADIEMATHIARNMVCKWGMSARLGLVAYAEDGAPSTGYDKASMTDSTGAMINDEVRAILDRAHVRARSVLIQQAPALKALAQALLERETLDAEEIRAVVRSAVGGAARLSAAAD
ncbi:MAG: ATP-dependent zinc metalloprotease FtsH [Rhodospirillales bacterium]|nr:ATP-dependent zinc metalloprotease FtsH [Rhodospirillales bacterium]